jgi:hypothetical protein
MKSRCLLAVAEAIGHELTKKEADGIESRIAKHLRALSKSDESWAAKTLAERLQSAAERAANELIGEAQLKEKRAALTVIAHDRIQKHIEAQAARGIDALNALDRTIAFHADLKSNFLSIESQANAIRDDSLRQMLSTLTASNPKWFGLFENRAGVEALVKEIFGEDSGVPEAKAGAKEWAKVTAAMRERFNRNGGDVGQLEDWGLPHHHSQIRVAKAGREKWVNDIQPFIDRDAYFNPDGSKMSDEQIGSFLGEAWTSIATGGANKLEPGQFKGNGARANRGNASRQIHFKDADSYLKYQDAYGERTPYEVLTNHIDNIAKDIALVETYGPNPDATFRYFRDKVVIDGKLEDPTKVGKLDERAIKSENLYNAVAGKTQPVASEWLANAFDTLRNLLVASRLGSAVITSFSDDATLHLTGKLNNLPAMRLLANELAAFNPANRTEERIAQRAGLGLRTLVSSLNRFGQTGLGSSFSKKLAATTLRASGLNAMTEARRRAFGATMMDAIGAVVKNHASLKTLDAADNRVLLSKGITDTDFQVWKKAELEDWGNGNKTVLTPESIYRIPDAELKDLGNPTQLREQAATKLLAHTLEETDVAIIEPGAKERAITGANIQRGALKGELILSFFLFKSFPLAMIERHFERGMSLPTVGGRAKYLAALIAATTVAGVASLQVNELLNGRDPRNMNPFEKGGVRNWIAAMLKGGSLGIYGDFLFSDATQHGQSPVASFMGPVIGTGESLFNLTQGNMLQAAQGKDTHFGAETVKFAKGLMPGTSLWYAKAALDHMIFHQLQEYFSPGYLANMRSRAQRDFDQRYWWEPGEVAPSRAPDLGAIAQ